MAIIILVSFYFYFCVPTESEFAGQSRMASLAGPAPAVLAMFMCTAIRQEWKKVPAALRKAAPPHDPPPSILSTS